MTIARSALLAGPAANETSTSPTVRQPSAAGLPAVGASIVGAAATGTLWDDLDGGGVKKAGPSRRAVGRAALAPRRKGEHVSLCPIAQPARLKTLALPFEAPAPACTPAASGAPVASAPIASAPVSNSEVVNAAISGGGSSARLAQQALVARLAREVTRMEVAGRARGDQLGRRQQYYSSGCSTMDGCLPGGGYESGTVVEYLHSGPGSGATTLALTAAREALSVTERYCVIVDWRQQFYPPAAAALGMDLKRVVIVRPASLADRLWAIDQALRSPAIVAVIAEVEQLDDRAARRLQLAAECGGGLGLLVRGTGQRHAPSWAEVQWFVRPVPAAEQSHRQLHLELLRARGGRSGTSLRVQINASSGRLEAPAALAQTLARKSG